MFDVTDFMRCNSFPLEVSTTIEKETKKRISVDIRRCARKLDAKKEKKLAAHHAVDLLRHLLEVVEAHAGGQRRQEGVADLLRNGVQDLLRVVALRLRRLRNLQTNACASEDSERTSTQIRNPLQIGRSYTLIISIGTPPTRRGAHSRPG